MPVIRLFYFSVLVYGNHNEAAVDKHQETLCIEKGATPHPFVVADNRSAKYNRPWTPLRCNGERPCLRCKTKSIHCEYTYKKRCGPKRRKGLDVNRGDGEGLLASCKLPAERLDDHLRGMAVMFNNEEVECVRVFLQNLNTFLPMTTLETMELAATPTVNTTEGSSVTDSQNEEANQLHHARRALLHGAIAVGAEILEKGEASITHAGIARQEIKEW